MAEKIKYKYCLVTIFFTVLLVTYFVSTDYVNTTVTFDISSHLSQVEYNDTIFTEIQEIKRTVSNIFFIETRCATKKSTDDFLKTKQYGLNARQTCAIESTARTNPGREIYVFLSCVSENLLPSFLQELTTLPKIHLVRLDSQAILRDTPAQRIGESGMLEKSAHPVEHSSDVLRLALLWKYGGTYADLDVVTIRSLDALGTDWAGMQDSGTIANGLLNISPSGPGHELLGRALEKLAKTYDPEGWAANGPGLLTPLILDLCGVDTVEKAVEDCLNFTVFNSSVLYPLHYSQWAELFDDTRGIEVLDKVVLIASSVHLWNKLSGSSMVKLNSTQAYALLAKRYCSGVATTVEEF